MSRRDRWQPERSAWLRSWSLGVALMLPLWAACNAPIRWSTSGQDTSATCSPWNDRHPQLQREINARTDAAKTSPDATSFEQQAGVLGCLIVTRRLPQGSNQVTRYFKLGQLQESGDLKTWNGSDFVGNPLKLDGLNKESGQATYRFQFYALGKFTRAIAGQYGVTSDDPSDETQLMSNFEIQFCGDAHETTYQTCLPRGAGKESWCAFVLEFKPTPENGAASDLLATYSTASGAITRVGKDGDSCVLYKPTPRPPGEPNDEPPREPTADASEPTPEPPDLMPEPPPVDELMPEAPPEPPAPEGPDVMPEPPPEPPAPGCINNCSFFHIPPTTISSFMGSQMAVSSTGEHLVSCNGSNCSAFRYNASQQTYAPTPIQIGSSRSPVTALSWAPGHEFLVVAGLLELKAGTLAQFQSGQTPFFSAPNQSGTSYTKAYFSGNAKRLYALTSGAIDTVHAWKFNAAAGPASNLAAPIKFGQTNSTTKLLAVHPSQNLVAVGSQRTQANQSWGVALYQEGSQGSYKETSWITTNSNVEPSTIAFHPSGKWLLMALADNPPKLFTIPIPIPTGGGVVGVAVPTSKDSWTGQIQQIRFSKGGELMVTLEVNQNDATQKTIRLWRFDPKAPPTQSPFAEIGYFPNLTTSAAIDWRGIAFGRGCNELISLTAGNNDTLQHWRCVP